MVVATSSITLANSAPPIADISTIKILLNSIISNPGARFATFNFKHFYLVTPMTRKEDTLIAITSPTGHH
jgi:hypothetical protein